MIRSEYATVPMSGSTIGTEAFDVSATVTPHHPSPNFNQPKEKQ